MEKSKAVGIGGPMDHGENSLPERRLRNMLGIFTVNSSGSALKIITIIV